MGMTDGERIEFLLFAEATAKVPDMYVYLAANLRHIKAKRLAAAVAMGYVETTEGRRTLYRMTETGRQAIRDMREEKE